MEDHATFVEQGRKLASLREDLICEGIDPAELLIPRLPEDCLTGEMEPRRRPPGEIEPYDNGHD